MFGGGEVDRKTAEIVLLERIEGEREPGPVEAGAGAAHGVEGELGGDVGFELEDRRAHAFFAVLAQIVLKASHDGDGGVGDVGHDLGHDGAPRRVVAGNLAQGFGVAVGRHAELGGHAHRPENLDEIPGQLGRADDKDDVRACLGEGVHDVRKLGFAVHRNRHPGDGLHRMLLEHAVDGGQTGGTEGKVGIGDGDAFHAGGERVIDQFAVLIEIARANVEDVGVERRAQRLGAGNDADDRELEGFGNMRLQHLGHRRRADRHQRGQGFGGAQLVEQGDRFVRVVAVVFAAQHELSAVNAAGRIGGLEGQPDAGVVLGGLESHRSGEGRHVGQDVFASRVGEHGAGKRQSGKAAAQCSGRNAEHSNFHLRSPGKSGVESDLSTSDAACALFVLRCSRVGNYHKSVAGSPRNITFA